MPRVLVAGPAGCYPAVGFGEITHGSHVRTLGIARAFAALGCETDLLDQNGHAVVRSVTDRDILGGLGSYDIVCVAGIAGLWRLRAGGHSVGLGCHPRVALMVDTVYGPPDAPADLEFVHLLLSTSPAVADFYAQHRAAALMHSPWGCSELPDMPSPWTDVARRVVFSGIVYPRFLAMLNDMAAALTGIAEVWVAGLFDSGGGFGGISPEARRELHGNLHLATDVLPLTIHGPGPVVYSDAVRMMQHADVGVNLVPRKKHLTIGTSCKVYDYLGAGLRVVSETSPACDGDVLALGGSVCPWGDTQAMATKVRAMLDQPHDRVALATKARQACSWRLAAERVLGYCGSSTS